MRKRIVLLPLALSLALSALSQAFVQDGIYYEVNSVSDKTLNLIWGGDCKGDVVLPESVTYNGVVYKISNIDDRAFSGCSAMTSIVIPEGVVGIGDEAFSGCTGLESISFPNSIAEISRYFVSPFGDCTSLTSINNYTTITYDYFHGKAWYDEKYNEWYNSLPDGIIRVGNVVVGYKGNLPDNKSIVIPDGVTYILDGAFENTEELSSVTIPASVTGIGKNAFNYCRDLASIQVQGNLKKIGQNAFQGTAWYNDQPDGLVIVGNVVAGFKGDYSETLIVPEGVTGIGDNSLSGYGFQTISLPSSLKRLGEHSLSYNRNIRSISLPQGLETIGTCTFYNCNNLDTVVIPQSVNVIRSAAFQACRNLSTINIPNGVACIKDDVFSGCEKITSITIPEGVISIGEDAFECCYNLSSVNIPEGVSRIGQRAFTECVKLTSISIPKGVEIIPDRTFRNCSNLNSLVIADGVKQIGEEAFSGCGNLNSIVVSSGNKYYDSRDNCNALIDTKTGTLLLGCSNTVIPKSISRIGDGAFTYCKDLKEITIPDNITKIGASAFYGCSGLESVAISNGVDSFGSYAFYYCTNLTSLTVPESVKSIGDNCFYNCNKIKTLNWGTEYPLTKVFNRRYDSSLDSLRTIIFGKGVKEIEYGLFGFNLRAENLESVTLSEGITKIGTGSFYGLTKLTSITIPSSVDTIGDMAFMQCESLTNVVIHGAPEIGVNAFANCPNIEEVYATSPMPGTMALFNPFIIGGDKISGNENLSVNQVYNQELGRNVIEVSSTTTTSWTCSFYLNGSLPSGSYKLKIGILPSPDNLPNYIHPVVYVYTSKGKTEVFNPEIMEQFEENGMVWDVYSDIYYSNDITKYDLMTIPDAFTIPEDTRSVVIELTSGVNRINKNKYSSLMVLDRIIFEPEGDEIPAELYAGPFSESVFKNATLYVPEGAVDAYRAADGWKLFKNIAVDPTVYPDQEVEVSISAAGYATFYNSLGSYRLPQGLSAMVVSGMSGDKLVYETIASGADNGVVPAGVPVILMSDSKRAGTFKLQLEYGSYEYDGSNLLYGSDEDTQTYADVNSRFYKLAYGPKGSDLKDVVGWYWGAANGAAFSIEGHKAWLALPMSKSKDKMSFSLSGDPTYVLEIDASGQEQETIVHDLQGRSISAPTGPGAYIINGKTVIITE